MCHLIVLRHLKPKSIIKFPPPRQTFFAEPKPSSRRVQFMIPETEGEWPLVNHPDGKKWRTTSAYKHAKTILKSSKAPKPLQAIVENCDDDAIATVEGKEKVETEEETEVDPKLVQEELSEKLRHYYRWVSSAHRAMHDACPFVTKVS